MKNSNKLNDNLIERIKLLEKENEELKLLNTSLALNENKFKSYLNNAPDGIILFDAIGTFTELNPAVSEITGYSNEEFLKLSFDSITPDFHKDEMLFHSQTLTHNGKAKIEIQYIHKHKGNRWWLVNSVKISENRFINFVKDITDRKKAEEDLKQSELRFKLIFDTLSEGVSLNEIIYDENGIMVDYKILEVNDSYFNVANYNKDLDVIGNYASILYKIPQEFITKFWENHKDNTHSVQTEYYTLSEKYYIISTSPFVNNHFVTTFYNITDRKKAEQKLIESEARFRNIIDLSPIPYALNDEELNITYLNPAFINTFGYTLEDIPNVQDWFPKAYPDNEYRDYVTKEWFGRIEKAKVSYSKFEPIELSITCKDGSIRYAIVDAGSLNENFKDIHLVTLYDITDRKKAESQIKESETFLRETQQITNLGTYSIDIIKGTWKSSEIHDEILGINKDFDKTIEGWLNITHPEIRNEMRDYFQIEVLQNKNDFNKEYKIIRQNDLKERWIQGLGKLKYDEIGNIISMVGTIRDITRRKQNEEEILNKNIELSEANSAKDRFFSIIAHDLKSPFSGFLGLTKILSEDINSLSINEINDISNSMQKSANNLYKLLENLLEWSRMQRDMIKYNPESIELKYIVKQNIDILYNFSHQKSIVINNFINEETKVYADIPMLNTVFRNLLSNAIKFTNNSGAIEIGTYDGYETENEFCIYVKDSGIGMDADLLNDLFKLDVKVSRPGTEGESSTGLGLILCNIFIIKNKGKLWVESTVKIGSTFYFTIPKGVVDNIEN